MELIHCRVVSRKNICIGQHARNPFLLSGGHFLPFFGQKVRIIQITFILGRVDKNKGDTAIRYDTVFFLLRISYFCCSSSWYTVNKLYHENVPNKIGSIIADIEKEKTVEKDYCLLDWTSYWARNFDFLTRRTRNSILVIVANSHKFCPRRCYLVCSSFLFPPIGLWFFYDIIIYI